MSSGQRRETSRYSIHRPMNTCATRMFDTMDTPVAPRRNAEKIIAQANTVSTGTKAALRAPKSRMPSATPNCTADLAKKMISSEFQPMIETRLQRRGHDPATGAELRFGCGDGIDAEAHTGGARGEQHQDHPDHASGAERQSAFDEPQITADRLADQITPRGRSRRGERQGQSRGAPGTFPWKQRPARSRRPANSPASSSPPAGDQHRQRNQHTQQHNPEPARRRRSRRSAPHFRKLQCAPPVPEPTPAPAPARGPAPGQS